MFVELIDHLRCPRPHAETWLVMKADETRDRHVLRGSLGCPICMQQFRVEDGMVFFDDAAMGDLPPAEAIPGDDAWPLRLAAFLGLADAGGAVGLHGEWVRYGLALADVVERVEPLAIAPAFRPPAHLSSIVPPAEGPLPLATASLRAVALDRHAPAALLAEAARVVRQGGRLLARSGSPIPPGVKELARDAEWWVGEREAGVMSGVVGIGRRR